MPVRSQLTPAQRTFGVGITPIERAFRPPQGMENDPIYNDYAREKWANVDFQDAQRGQVQAALAAQEDLRAQRIQEREMQDVEQRATEAMRGKSPDEIPNILAQFPELARSKNLGGFTNFAQAVTPSAGQRTLAPSLRNKLKPHERQYFDEHFTQGGDAISAFDAAQMRGEHENSLAEMMQKGVPLEVVDKYRDKRLSPIEREALIQQHKPKESDPEKKALLDGIFKDIDESYVAADNETPLDVAINKSKLKKQAIASIFAQPAPQQPATQPVATGGQAVPVATNTPVAAQQQAIAPAVRQAIPDDGTGAFTGIISNPNIPEAERNEAFTKLKTIIESATPPKGSTFTDVDKFKKGIQERLDAAKVDLNASRFASDVAPIWTKEKDIVGKAINRMAQDLGVEEDVIIASIFPAAQNGKPALPQKIPMSIVPKEMQPRRRNKFGEREVYAKDLLAAYLADQKGKNPADASYEKDAKMKIEDLSGFVKAAGNDPIYVKALKKVGMDTDRTQEDVIREYIKSKIQPVATPQAANSPQPPVAKIKSVREIR